MWEVMHAYVITHNLIIESERMSPAFDDHRFDFHSPLATVYHDVPTNFANFLSMHAEVRDADVHTKLQNDLIPI
jgi:hypothetical protein